MRRRRGMTDERLLCSGPGRLARRWASRARITGCALDKPPFELRARTDEPEIAVGPRIGITKAAEVPWRYGLAGSSFSASRSRQIDASTGHAIAKRIGPLLGEELC